MNDPFRNLPSQNAGCGGDPSFAVSRVRGQSLPDTAPLLDEERRPGLIPSLARRIAELVPWTASARQREG